MQKQTYSNGYLNAEPLSSISEQMLCDPSILDAPIRRYILIDVIHKYVNASTRDMQMSYLHYLIGKNFEESAHILNISESKACCNFHTFISRFHRFILSQMKKGNIDIEEASRYIKCLQDQKMDDQQVAASFEEDMSTTKVMKHFLKHANIISQYFITSVPLADTLELITFIDFIHILPK